MLLDQIFNIKLVDFRSLFYWFKKGIFALWMHMDLETSLGVSLGDFPTKGENAPEFVGYQPKQQQRNINAIQLNVITPLH